MFVLLMLLMQDFINCDIIVLNKPTTPVDVRRASPTAVRQHVKRTQTPFWTFQILRPIVYLSTKWSAG